MYVKHFNLFIGPIICQILKEPYQGIIKELEPLSGIGTRTGTIKSLTLTIPRAPIIRSYSHTANKQLKTRQSTAATIHKREKQEGACLSRCFQRQKGS